MGVCGHEIESKKSAEPKVTTISHLVYLEKKKILIAGNSNGVVRFITLSPLQKVAEIKAHESSITAMVITPDEKYLITAESIGWKPLKIWDTETFKLAKTISQEVDVSVAIERMAVTPDNKTLITANKCGSLQWIDITSHRMVQTVIKSLHRYQIQGQYEDIDRCCSGLRDGTSLLKAFQLSHDGKRMALAYGYNEFIVNTESMKTEHELSLLFEGGLQGDFLFSHDDQSVLFSYRWEDEKGISNPLSKYDLKSKKVTRENFSFKNRLASDHNQSRLAGYIKSAIPYDIDRLKDGQLLSKIKNTHPILSNLLIVNNNAVFASNDESIYFYDFDDGELTAELKLE